MDGERSRIDERYYKALPVNQEWLEESEKWVGIKTILSVARKRRDKR